VAISCPKCSQRIDPERFNKPPFPCTGCSAEIQVAAFASLISGPSTAGVGQRLVVSDQASCFYHPDKQATVPCDNCGRFLCALCDVDFGGKSICPACIEGASASGTSDMDTRRILYDKLALFLAFMPMIVTQFAALFMVLRYWSSPICIPKRGPLKWRWVLTVIVALLELWVFYAIIFGGLLD